MSSSRHRRRGQTSVEVLFIIGIILTGIVIITPSYLDENRSASLVTYVRNSATSACAYLNSGAITNDNQYRVLNRIITASNYTSKSFRVVSVKSSESGDTITINVRIEYSGKIDLKNGGIAWRIKTFITRDLVAHSDAKLSGGTLYYGDKKVVIKVKVVRA
ncbi:conserved protein of unknown function [Thermococcus camini]|uniref:Class III signal peptide-containing protein n=1 Tax=Thermococcus camini TaxID=2016373 RepID=A0A7G2D4P6_9EURY|nr:conserved protein of unknown function [Thermococcus camini]